VYLFAADPFLPKPDMNGGSALYHMRESELLLNRNVLVVPGNDVTFRVHYWGNDMNHYDNPVHKHSFFEACYVWDGHGVYIDDGEPFPLRKGALFCSRPGVVHQIRSKQGLSLLFVAFEVDEKLTIAEEADRFRRLAVEAERCVYDADDSPTASLWKSLLLPSRDVQRLSYELLPSVANLLLRSFADVFSPQRPVPAGRGRASGHLLQRAKLFIRDNLDQPITLERVARYLHVSERHVSRIFSEGIHESFNRYVREARIQQAAYLLKSTDLSIKEIAEQTGFGTVHSFTRAFAREKQMPPGRYRSGLR
jgi:AraC-like DNA-binding protein/mannose-6-phosphate isomerase-like protein (cupin superfamily)